MIGHCVQDFLCSTDVRIGDMKLGPPEFFDEKFKQTLRWVNGLKGANKLIQLIDHWTHAENQKRKTQPWK
jgi:hypothetical protein